MNEPTQEQIGEFWEWCGFKWISNYWGDCYCQYPNGEEVPFRPGEDNSRYVPILDLNNLFRYAVPKLQSCVLSTSLNSGYICNAYFDGKWSRVSRNVDPVLALFWAIWEVMHEEDKGERKGMEGDAN